MTRVVKVAAIALLLLGLTTRLAPLFDAGGRLLQQWPTEDGYLMWTVARNMALGEGMSTSAGAIPTNGVQPAATYLWSLSFRAVDGDKPAAALLIQSVSIVLALLTMVALYWLGRRVFTQDERGRACAALAAVIWWCSPVATPHTMNGLETGLYLWLSVLAWWAWIRSSSSSRPGAPVVLGLILGAVFWARIDAVFVVGAMALAHVGASWGTSRARHAARQALVFCSISAVVALPWLIHNTLAFGSPMPISGHSESMDAHFADNLLRLPAILFETMTVVLPVPERWEEQPLVAGLTGVAWLGFAFLSSRLWRGASGSARRLVIGGCGFLLCLALYYGLFFGAGHFLGRYLAPVAPLVALASIGLAARGIDRCSERARAGMVAALLTVVFAGCASLHLRTYRHGDEHAHWPVVEWIAEHATQDDWVAAVQTGTLGFFHDRTVNLDGKVNPWALARKERDQIAEYVSLLPVRFIADWNGIAEWAERPVFREHFRCRVNEPEQNLAVLERTGPVPNSAVAEVR